MRQRILGLGLTALALLVVVPGVGDAAPNAAQFPTRQAQVNRASAVDENATITADAAPDSRNGSSEARRFDPPWAALAVAALLVAASQRMQASRSRRRLPAPLTTRAPARAPPFVTAFAPAQ